jgi:hypothetical protein
MFSRFSRPASIPMTIIITPIKELDGRYWVAVSSGGAETSRKGPFLSADAAEAVAQRLNRIGRAFKSWGLNGDAAYG